MIVEIGTNITIVIIVGFIIAGGCHFIRTLVMAATNKW